MINRLCRGLAAAAVLLAAGAASADTIAQSFSPQGTIKPGYVVALTKDSTTTVVAAPAGQSQLIYGVDIDPSQAPATLQRDSGQQTFVATTGTYPVFVSTENGNINVGDYLSISDTDGIAAKASNQQTYVLGQALQKFDGSSGDTGKIKVNVVIRRNPGLKENLAVPSALRNTSETIAGREISPVRIYSALAVFLIAAAIAFGALTVGIRSAITSIGRNPLSRHFILRGLLQVIAVSLAVLVLGIIGVYLLLRI